MPRYYGNRFNFEEPYAGRSALETASAVAGDTLANIRRRKLEDEARVRADRAEERETTRFGMEAIEHGWEPDEERGEPPGLREEDEPEETGGPRLARGPQARQRDAADFIQDYRDMGPTANLVNATTSGMPARTDTGQVPSHYRVKGWRYDEARSPGALAQGRNRELTVLSHDLSRQDEISRSVRDRQQKQEDEDRFVQSQVDQGMSPARARAQYRAGQMWQETPGGRAEDLSDFEAKEGIRYKYDLRRQRAGGGASNAIDREYQDLDRMADNTRSELARVERELENLQPPLPQMSKKDPEGYARRQQQYETSRAALEKRAQDAGTRLSGINRAMTKRLGARGVSLDEEEQATPYKGPLDIRGQPTRGGAPRPAAAAASQGATRKLSPAAADSLKRKHRLKAQEKIASDPANRSWYEQQLRELEAEIDADTGK